MTECTLPSYKSLEDSSQIEMLQRYPLLFPTDSALKHYEGFLRINQLSFHVSLEVPHYPTSQDLSLSCDWTLQELLSSHSKDILQCLETSSSLLCFLDKFCQLVANILITDGANRLSLIGGDCTFEEQVDSLKHYTSVLSEIHALGTEHLQQLSSDLKTVSLVSNNLDEDVLTLTLKLHSHYSDSNSGKSCLEVIETDLPDPVIKIIEKEPNITKAYHKFCEQLEALHPVWSSLSLIDNQCWVIDPKHPKKADTYRRISISARVMAQISWNPLVPRQHPEIKFQGSDVDVDRLRLTYEENLEEWSPNADIIQNLCSILSLNSLPEPPDSVNVISQAVGTGECCICYDIHLNGTLPEESCGKCLNSFHAACLYEWLEMMPGSRQVHGHISGSCPNCETIIKCPCPHAIA